MVRKKLLLVISLFSLKQCSILFFVTLYCELLNSIEMVAKSLDIATNKNHGIDEISLKSIGNIFKIIK
tara:strand:+ start:3419 stop:3622 length:204 start_codon:yes stop_codon:yes gene_type:complete